MERGHQTPEENDQIRAIQFVAVGKQTQVPAPLIRVTTCGLLTIETVQELVSTDPPQARYASLTPEQQRGRGTAPALLLLKLLVSRPKRYALRDWLMEQFCQDRELFSDARLDNLAWLLRKLLCPPGYDDLRTQLVAHVQSASGSGNGYQLASYPLIWVDSEAVAWNVEQAVRMERFGDDPLPFWERAYDLAKRGSYLPDELYSDWAETRRGEVAGMLRQSVQALARLYQERHGKAGEEEALLVLRSYWQEHPREEDVLRPLMELLGRRECYQEALEYYERLCALLEEEDCKPDTRTQDIAEYVRTKQIQRSAVSKKSGHPQDSVASAVELSIGQNVIGETQEAGDQHLDSQRRKLLQRALEIAGTTLVPTLDLFQAYPFNVEKRSQSSVGLVYEHLLALSWEHYYTTSAQRAARYIDQWLLSLIEAARETRSEEQAHILRLLCRFYQLSGVIARDRLDFSRALADGKTSIELAFHLDNAELIASALFRRARTFLKCQQMMQAIQDLEAALAYAQRVRDPLKGYVHQATAAVYALLAEQDKTFQSKSLHLFDQVATIIASGKGEDDGSFVKLNTAGLAFDRAKALVAFQHYSEAHGILETAQQELEIDITRWQVHLLLTRADISLAENDPQQSCELASQALRVIQLTRSLSNKQRLISLHERLQQRFPSYRPVAELAGQLQEAEDRSLISMHLSKKRS